MMTRRVKSLLIVQLLLVQSVFCLPMKSLSHRIAERAVAQLIKSTNDARNPLALPSDQHFTDANKRTSRGTRGSGFLARDQPVSPTTDADLALMDDRLYKKFLASNSIQPGQLVSSTYEPVLKPSGTFSYTLICKNGYLLSMEGDGDVKGGLQRNKSTVLDFQVWGKDLVTIWSPSSKRYLAMDSNGILKTVENRTIETFFIHRLLPTLYRSFHSLYYHQQGWHIGIRKNGNLKRGRPSVGKIQTAFQFVIVSPR